MTTVDTAYTVIRPNSLSERLAAYQRRKMFLTFLAITHLRDSDTVLDVGVTSDRTLGISNHFEAWCPNKARITASSIDDASFLEEMYPGLQFVRGDGRSLPFADGSFDYVHSNAVLEHVGNRENQRLFIHEAWRVTRKGIFITTPNRFFPIELHTGLPLLHWLPARWYRRLLRDTKVSFATQENNVNLLSRSELKRIAQEAGANDPSIRDFRLGGWTCNLAVIALRKGRDLET